jgi:molybdopterin-guanine dinucleotide biosynthesis protein A
VTVRETGVTGIVLAGGRARRFGSDKLLADVDGRPLVCHAIDALAATTGRVLLVLAPGVPTPVRETEIVTVVRDRMPFEGPLAGLLTGLEVAGEPVAIVVGGDMPGLVPAVLEALVAGLADPAADAAVLVADGQECPLPLALRVGAGTATASDLLASGERSLRALVRALRTQAIPEAEWRRLDPAASTIDDVDRPEDLQKRRRPPSGGQRRVGGRSGSASQLR